MNASGQIVSQSRYLPFGELLWEDGASPTDYTYTGQRSLSDIGLMDYNARFYDPMLGRFTSPDSIVPEPGSVIGYNRFAYVNNNPMIYTDPTGHFCYDANTNTFTDDCTDNYDVVQQELLDFFIGQIEAKDGDGNDMYTDLELAENLLNLAVQKIDEPVAALRAASEIVREATPPDWNWSYTRSRFFYEDYTKERFDDSGFGDLADTEDPNQIGHLTGIAYISGYQEQARSQLLSGSSLSEKLEKFVPSDILVVGNEFKNKGQSINQTTIDMNLGFIAADLGVSIVKKKEYAISKAIKKIKSYKSGGYNRAFRNIPK